MPPSKNLAVIVCENVIKYNFFTPIPSLKILLLPPWYNCLALWNCPLLAIYRPWFTSSTQLSFETRDGWLLVSLLWTVCDTAMILSIFFFSNESLGVDADLALAMSVSSCKKDFVSLMFWFSVSVWFARINKNVWIFRNLFKKFL